MTAPVAADRPSPGRLRVMLVTWLVSMLVALALVIYGLGPMFQEREQRSLARQYTELIDQAANESTGLGGVTTSTRAPELGAPVGILEIGSIRVQQVVVEGAGSSQTRKGPGHVPGTAGLGQPGNTVIVGRHGGFGGPFGALDEVQVGDKILVSTTQGQSVYEVTSVSGRDLKDSSGSADGLGSAPAVGVDEGAAPIEVDDLYGPTEGDQLTLVTSGSRRPDNKSRAILVVAELKSEPFAPTPQGGRSEQQTGLTGDSSARATVLLAILAYGATLGATVVLYRRVQPRTAYLLSVGPVLAMTVVAGETLSRMLPAWL